MTSTDIHVFSHTHSGWPIHLFTSLWKQLGFPHPHSSWDLILTPHTHTHTHTQDSDHLELESPKSILLQINGRKSRHKVLWYSLAQKTWNSKLTGFHHSRLPTDKHNNMSPRCRPNWRHPMVLFSHWGVQSEALGIHRWFDLSPQLFHPPVTQAEDVTVSGTYLLNNESIWHHSILKFALLWWASSPTCSEAFKLGLKRNPRGKSFSY